VVFHAWARQTYAYSGLAAQQKQKKIEPILSGFHLILPR
jgi:hypothetical protein